MSKESFPSAIASQVKEFHLSLINLKKELGPIANNLYQIKDEIEKTEDPIKQATLELTLCQALNSLFYMYLQTSGVDAGRHPIGHELYRVEKYTNRLNQIKDKDLRPQIIKRAASAFVRNALFDPESGDNKPDDDWESGDEESKKENDNDDPAKEKPAKRLRTE